MSEPLSTPKKGSRRKGKLLTDAACKAAKVDFGKKFTKFADSGGLYLYVRLTVSGAVTKQWKMDYKFNGKWGSASLGRYPDYGLVQAREWRDKVKDGISRGISPSSGVAARDCTQPETFQELAELWLESDYKRRVVESTFEKGQSHLKNNVYPEIGYLPITEITPLRLLDLYNTMRARDVSGSIPKARSLINMILGYAVIRGEITFNPNEALKRQVPKHKAKHRPAIIDPDKLGPLLVAISNYKGKPLTRLALRLATIVYIRSNELRELMWRDINLDKALFNYKPSKEKDQETIPYLYTLPRQAVEILRQIKSISGRSEYVFPSANGATAPFMSDSTLSAALRRMGFSGVQTHHGFRATATTILLEKLKCPDNVCHMLLGHVVKDANGNAYNRTTWMDERREFTQKWADLLDSLRLEEESLQGVGGDPEFTVR